MTKRSLIALLLAVIMCLALVSCGGDKPEDTKPTVVTTAEVKNNDTTADDTTAANTPDDTTAEETTAEETTVEETTEEQITDYGLNGYGKLDDDEMKKLINLYPATLPDNSLIEKVARVFCGDDVPYDDTSYCFYDIQGNSKDHTKIVGTDEGAIYGTAFKMQAYGANTSNRCEIQLQIWTDTCEIEVNPKGAKGVLFYVDFSHVASQTGDSAKPACASVTFNTNDYRSKNGIGYYYENGVWVETKSINACRMAIPEQFVGWIYVPATSYVNTKDGDALIADEKGLFPDFSVTNMRCYTDGYVYSDAPENYVIFDEITFVY